MAAIRYSAVQKQILMVLLKGVASRIEQPKSTTVNAVVNQQLQRDIHPNNFRTSCAKLESRGLIRRRKHDLDWYLNITPAGLELAFKYLEETA